MAFDPSDTPPPEPDDTCSAEADPCALACDCTAKGTTAQSGGGVAGHGDGGGGDECMCPPCDRGQPEPADDDGGDSCECDQDCGCGGGASARPVRYFNGEIQLSVNDIIASGFGWAWGHTRTYSNRLSSSYDFGNGFNWLVQQWAYMTEGQDGSLVFVRSPRDSVWFDPDGGGFVARFGAAATLEHDEIGHLFRVMFPAGEVWEFHDFDQTQFPLGALRRFITPGGQTIDVTGYTSDNRISQVERTHTVDGVSVTESLAYGYGVAADAGRLASVTLRRRTGGAPWTDIRRVRYTYYQAGDEFGSAGDLRTVTYDVPTGVDWVERGTSYYRYYLEGQAGGFQHGLRFVLNSRAFARLKQAAGNPFLASDGQVAQFADFYFEYDSEQRAVLERVAAGSQEHTFAYTTSTNADAPNSWKQKTVETLPDASQWIVYTNFVGQVMLKELKQGADRWIHYRRYGEADDPAARFRLVERAAPAAVVDYNDTEPELDVTLRPDAGLIRRYAFFDGTGGTPVGYPSEITVQEGTSGTPVKVRSWEWVSHTAGDVTVYNVASQTAYKSDASGGSHPITTSFAYTYHPDTVQVAQRTTTLPVVPETQNGSGVAAVRRVLRDIFGYMTWEQGPRGFIDKFSHDFATGAQTQMIDDIDPTLHPLPDGWTRPGNLPAPLNLVYDYIIDDLGRHIEKLGPLHAVDGVAVRTADWTVYLDAQHETRTARGFATPNGASYAFTLVNPVTITRRDRTGADHDIIRAARAETNGRLTASDLFPQSSWRAWTQRRENARGQITALRVYHAIPGPGCGCTADDVDETAFGYDLMGRQNLVRSPGGTITRTVFDPRGLPLRVYVGTNDAGATDNDPTGGGATGNNMVLVAENEYDNGTSGGDGNLTQTTLPVDDNSGADRVTSYEYDFRNRRMAVTGELDFFERYFLDNLNRVVKTERRDGSATGQLLAQTETLFDDRGRVYRRRRWGVHPSTGALGNVLTSDFWFDEASNRIKQVLAGASAFTKFTFDGIGRAIGQYAGYYTGAGDEPYSEVGQITANNKIFQQTLTAYDAASNVIQSTLFRRFHNATGGGPLNLPTESQPRARVSYRALYSDGAGRPVAEANFGTHGNQPFERPPLVPERADNVLVVSTGYNDAGLAFQSIDPAGVENRTQFDAASRPVALIQNFIELEPGCPCPCGDMNVTTRLAYTPDGPLAELVAVNPDTGDQRTQFLYGTTLADSALARSDLLRAVVYPDALDSADRVLYGYNRQSELTAKTDQNGTRHDFDYDKLGRLTSDAVPTLGAGVDAAVRRLEMAFDVRGLLSMATSFDAAAGGNVVNQVERAYNGFDQLVTEYQAQGGAVNTGTTPKVGYGYADGAANTVRAVGLEYPDGRQLEYNYGAAGGDGDRLSRIDSIDDAVGGPRVAYMYLGLDDFVQADYPEPEVRWDLITGSGANPYAGLDRFDRVIDCLWRRYGGTPANLDRFQYGYDRASNRIWRRNAISPAGHDELYAYDRLHRLVEMARGSLSLDRQHVDDMQFTQDWTIDPTGNWNRFTQTLADEPSENLDQSRWQNPANEITRIARRYGPDWATPQYDRAGNMTVIPKPEDPTETFAATYDAWNRLVHLSDIDATYRYDALYRRVTKDVDSTHRHFYYTADWQCLEERLNSSTDPDRQYLWGLRYIDDLVLRDRSVNSILDERLYALQDANWNVTAICNSDGQIQERYAYTAYGVATIFAPNFTTRPTSDYAWNTLYAGYRWDAESRLYQVRRRYLHSTLGIWTARDVVGYLDGENLYWYANGNPNTVTDPSGECSCCAPTLFLACTARRNGLIFPFTCASICTGRCWNPGCPCTITVVARCVNTTGAVVGRWDVIAVLTTPLNIPCF